jgi:hypothetical protein
MLFSNSPHCLFVLRYTLNVPHLYDTKPTPFSSTPAPQPMPSSSNPTLPPNHAFFQYPVFLTSCSRLPSSVYPETQAELQYPVCTVQYTPIQASSKPFCPPFIGHNSRFSNPCPHCPPPTTPAILALIQLSAHSRPLFLSAVLQYPKMLSSPPPLFSNIF